MTGDVLPLTLYARMRHHVHRSSPAPVTTTEAATHLGVCYSDALAALRALEDDGQVVRSRRVGRGMVDYPWHAATPASRARP